MHVCYSLLLNMGLALQMMVGGMVWGALKVELLCAIHPILHFVSRDALCYTCSRGNVLSMPFQKFVDCLRGAKSQWVASGYSVQAKKGILMHENELRLGILHARRSQSDSSFCLAECG